MDHGEFWLKNSDVFVTVGRWREESWIGEAERPVVYTILDMGNRLAGGVHYLGYGKQTGR